MSNDKNIFNLNNGFTNLWTSVLTPLNADFLIDINKYIVHVKTLLSNDSEGVCIFDQYGEGPSFSLQERKDLLDELIKAGIPSSSILVCTTAASIEDMHRKQTNLNFRDRDHSHAVRQLRQTFCQANDTARTQSVN
jgi:hypothetical protein